MGLVFAESERLPRCDGARNRKRGEKKDAHLRLFLIPTNWNLIFCRNVT